MSEVRPYIVEDEGTYVDAVDLNIVTRITMCENGASRKPEDKWLVILTMYYSEPVTLEFSSKAAARMKFNELIKVWSTELTKIDYGSSEPVLKTTNITDMENRISELEKQHAVYGSDVDNSHKSIIEQWIDENLKHPDTRKYILGDKNE